MTKKLIRTSYIAGTLALFLSLTGCESSIDLSEHDSDYEESVRQVGEDTAKTVTVTTGCAVEDAADDTSDTLSFDSDDFGNLVLQLVAFSDTLNTEDDKEAAKLYDDEKRLAEHCYQMISVHTPLTTDTNKFYDKARLTGSFDAWAFEVNKDKSVEIPYTFTVTQGTVKVILVSPDKKVTTLIEKVGSSKDKPKKGTLKINLKKGYSIIRIVGKNKASYCLEMTPPDGKHPNEDSE